MSPEETRQAMQRLASPMPRAPIARPCDSKAKFYSPREAMANIRWLQECAPQRDQTPQNYYYCRWHDAYHLTHNEEVWS